jgi:putative Holliday junction resolvase
VTVLGLDYGERRIGAAISDELGVAAHALPTILCDGNELDRLRAIVSERAVRTVVVGLPLRMNGTEGSQARRARGFVKRLGRSLPGVAIEMLDERLTTAQAHAALSGMGAKRRQRHRHADAVAAQIILQRYLGRASGGARGGHCASDAEADAR